ncbi:MAG: hypothetical protein ACREVA_04785 [Burkholderiales bacterium]
MNQVRAIELPEEIFFAVLRLSELRGVSPAQWIASQIPLGLLQRERPLADALNGIVGGVDSSQEPHHPQGPFSLISDLIAEKFRKQGLNIP